MPDDPSEGGPADTLKGVLPPCTGEGAGVTGTQALRHLKDEDYLKLASNAQYTWEKKTLEECFRHTAQRYRHGPSTRLIPQPEPEATPLTSWSGLKFGGEFTHTLHAYPGRDTDTCSLPSSWPQARGL